MGKFFLGIVVGVVVAVLGIFIFALAIGKLFATKQPTVASNSVLVLNLEGDIPEASPVDISIPFLQPKGATTIRDLWTSLHQAATDSRIKAILLRPESLGIGSAKLQEIHEELLDFKKSGKPIYAFLQAPGSREFYLASAADKIYMSSDDNLNVKGARAEVMYFKDALSKIGVNFQVDHIGAYKDYGDMFTRTNMSPQTREVLNQIVDQIYSDFCTTVGQGRHKSADDMRASVDNGPFTASQAKANGLVDEIGYEDQAYSDLKRKANAGNLSRISIKTYSKAYAASGDRIALLVGEGDIVPSSLENNVGGDAQITYEGIHKMVEEVEADSSIKGVILRVDSPGGETVASDEILHELRLLSSKRPVVISFSDLAASGGYYLSMTGDQIIAYPDTITGSIGVVYARPNVQGLLAKLGINEESVSRGKLAGIDSLAQPLSDAGQQKIHESLMETYNTFVSKVAAARRRSFDQIEPIAQGHVWMGAQARQNGLVDDLGGLNRAVAAIRQKAKLSPNGQTNLVVFPPKRSLWEVLTKSSSPDDVAEAAIQSKLRQMVPGLPSQLLLRGGSLRLMPYRITVQ